MPKRSSPKITTPIRRMQKSTPLSDEGNPLSPFEEKSRVYGSGSSKISMDSSGGPFWILMGIIIIFVSFWLLARPSYEGQKTLFMRFLEHHWLVFFVVLWIAFLGLYIAYVVFHVRAIKLMPQVEHLIQSGDGVCFQETVKDALEASGVKTSGVWSHIVRLVSKKENIDTIKMPGAKPFWQVKKAKAK